MNTGTPRWQPDCQSPLPQTALSARLPRRRLLTALAGTATWIGACSRSNPSAGQPAAEGSRLRPGTTLFFMNDIGGPYAQVMEEWAQTFLEKTQVRVELSPGTQDYTNKLLASFASGTPPDIFRYLYENIPIVAAVERLNMLMRLDNYLKRDRYDLSDFRKEAIELYRWKGSLYALPRDYGLQLIWYNVEHFRQAGLTPPPADWQERTWTFDRLLETARQLTRRTGSEVVQWGMRVPRGWRLWASWVYANGGAVVKKNADGLATEFALTEPPAVEALQFVQDLIYKHRVAPTPAEEQALGSWQTDWQAGRLSMFITNPGANSWFRPNSGVPYDVGVFPIGPRATRRGVGGGGTGWAGASLTKHPEEVWAFLMHITSREGQLVEVKVGQTTPSRISVVLGPEYLDPASPPEHKRAFAEGQEYVVRDPVAERWPDVQREVVEPTLNQLFWSGQASAKEVAERIKSQGDPYFR